MTDKAISPLRQRMIEDMTIRKLRHFEPASLASGLPRSTDIKTGRVGPVRARGGLRQSMARIASRERGGASRQIDQARSFGDRLISRNSRPARSVSVSSTDQSCRHCSGRRKSRAGRNSASRHHTRNNEGPGQYTRDVARGAPYAAPRDPGKRAEGCCSVADDSPAGSRSRASAAAAAYELAQPARPPAATTGREQLIDTRRATSAHHRQSAAGWPFKSECKVLHSFMLPAKARGGIAPVKRGDCKAH
jgi:hypothetical protein